METVTEFLSTLARQGVKLSAHAGQLNCYSRQGALTNDLRNGIIKFKTELIALLEGTEDRHEAQTEKSSSRQVSEFPLSSGQKGLYILQTLQPTMSAYNVPLCFKINADINVEIMAQAWDHVLEQFPILTARVIERDGTLYQRFDDSCRSALQQRPVAFGDDELLLSFLRKQAKQPFDLNRGPLTRIELFIRDGQKSILLLTVHHIVFDGASAVIVLRSLLEFYQQLSEGRPPAPSYQLPGYQEFIAWEEAMLASPEGAAHARYWRQQLDGELPTTELLPDRPRPASASFEGKTMVEDLPEDLCRWVRQFSKAHSVPPSVIFLAVFQLLLHRYTNQDDIIVGMPVMGRAAQQFSADVGYFINMVPLRAHCGGRIELMEFLRKVQGTMMDALYRSSYPFPLMIEGLKSTRRENSPIFRVSFAYQNFVAPTDFLSLLQRRIFQLEHVAGVWQEGDFDLGLEIYEAPESSFIIHLKYNPDLYTQNTIICFLDHYRVLLTAVSENPNELVQEYPILTKPETQKLLIDFNDTRADYPREKCIHELFVEQVARHAESVAVVCGDDSLTYRQLYEQSQNLALYLQSLGVGPDRLVGLCMERSLDMVVGLLGILQAGAAYLPLDPEDPNERLAQMLRDSGAAYALTVERLQDRLRAAMPADTRLITVDQQREEIVERVAELKARKVPLEQKARPDDLAYVVYTSGSTVRSDYVEVTHLSVVNLLCSIRRKLGITQQDTLLSVTTLPFDVAALEVYLPLCTGARLVVATRQTALDGARLVRKLRSCGATMLQATPATWRLLLDAGWKGDPKLTMLCGGDRLPRDLANQLLEAGCRLWNLYGTTESTIWSSASLVEPGNGPVPLGFPIDNTQMYILDQYNLPQPPGVPGELHIAGDGLARGYRNHTELTQTKFVACPFRPGARMYKTGDLARWLDNGHIQYVGRIDTQVNIRGFRIELGEIEARLIQHSGIRDSAVFAQGLDANKRLIAVYRAKDTTADQLVRLPHEDLRRHLLRTLPEYMVPVAFVSLAAIPLNPNGKVDRPALADVILKQQLAYWQKKLAGVPESLDLATDYARPSVQSFAGAIHSFALDAQLTGQLKSLAQRKGGTLYMILLAALNVLLYRYTGQNDLCVASPVGSEQRGADDPPETFGNVVALRSQVEGDDTFSALVSQVKATCLEAYEHQNTPFEHVVDSLFLQRRSTINPIVQVMLIVQTAAIGTLEQRFPRDRLANAVTDFDLTVMFMETPEGLAGRIKYSTTLYKPQTVERVAGHLTAICRSVAATPTAKIRDLDYISNSERLRVLVDFNDTRADYPKDKCTHQLFAAQVLVNPEKTAAVCGQQELSYQELDHRSGDLALYLQFMGVKPDGVVVLCAERSIDMMVGIMGTALAGGAYLPLDPVESDERLSYILQDSQAAIVLTQEKFRYKIGALIAQNTQLIALDKQWPTIRKCVASLRTQGIGLREDVKPHNLSYVMYTSDSAGRPSGVLVEHSALVNRINWMQNHHPLKPNDAVLQQTPYSSDVAVGEVFWPLTAGASVVFAAPERHDDVPYLESLITNAKVTTLHLTPSMLQRFLESDGGRCSSVQRIFCSGEALGRTAVDRYQMKFQNASLHNLYGPAEATITATAYDCDCARLDYSFAPIGAPIDNTQVYVLDRHNHPQPIGIRGELFIAGDGLARGYLNRAKLTREKFVANPFGPGTRMYKTGDLARWLDDGNIQYLGENKRAS